MRKGKVHPDPAAADPTAAALRLLPAAILALTAALRPEDRQVLAYLVTRSLHGGRRGFGGGGGGRPHPPAIGCGCFDCYTSFWSRWDCSPDRELIHEAIDAFEDHLAVAESTAASAPCKRREKGKRKQPPPPPPPPTPSEASAEKVLEPSSPPTPPAAPDSSNKVPEASTSGEERGGEVEVEVEAEAGEEGGNRGWADVMGMLNLRLWGIWSPAVESAT